MLLLLLILLLSSLSFHPSISRERACVCVLISGGRQQTRANDSLTNHTIQSSLDYLVEMLFQVFATLSMIPAPAEVSEAPRQDCTCLGEARTRMRTRQSARAISYLKCHYPSSSILHLSPHFTSFGRGGLRAWSWSQPARERDRGAGLAYINTRRV